jgi:hypothetical protein
MASKPTEGPASGRYWPVALGFGLLLATAGAVAAVLLTGYHFRGLGTVSIGLVVSVHSVAARLHVRPTTAAVLEIAAAAIPWLFVGFAVGWH